MTLYQMLKVDFARAAKYLSIPKHAAGQALHEAISGLEERWDECPLASLNGSPHRSGYIVTSISSKNAPYARRASELWKNTSNADRIKILKRLLKFYE